MKVWLFVVVAIGMAWSAPARSEDGLGSAIGEDYAYLEALYHHLHRNPEISFQEEKSAARMAAELAELGFKVTTGVGGHGLVGVMENGDGPTVLLRADMDGLPVLEQTGLAYASTATTVDEAGNTVPTMHACGHDVHMTVFVGAARRLAALKDQWRGTLVMIGQPAEERGAGAVAMLNDGLFERFPRPDYNLALHVNAQLAARSVAYVSGYALANVDSVDITVHGVGGHGAYPHTTKDPVTLSGYIITALQTLVAREVSPLEPAVVTVGSIHGGTKHNIIPDEVKLQLTVRSYTDEVRATLLDGIERIAVAQARAFGLPEDKLPVVKLARGEFTPATYNDPALTERIAGVLKARLGEANVVETGPVMGGEDFGRYGRVEPKIPSLILWLGAVDPVKIEAAKASGDALPSLHSPFFAPLPEPTITTGVEVMTSAALDLLGKR